MPDETSSRPLAQRVTGKFVQALGDHILAVVITGLVGAAALGLNQLRDSAGSGTGPEGWVPVAVRGLRIGLFYFGVGGVAVWLVARASRDMPLGYVGVFAAAEMCFAVLLEGGTNALLASAITLGFTQLLCLGVFSLSPVPSGRNRDVRATSLSVPIAMFLVLAIATPLVFGTATVTTKAPLGGPLWIASVGLKAIHLAQLLLAAAVIALLVLSKRRRVQLALVDEDPELAFSFGVSPRRLGRHVVLLSGGLIAIISISTVIEWDARSSPNLTLLIMTLSVALVAEAWTWVLAMIVSSLAGVVVTVATFVFGDEWALVVVGVLGLVLVVSVGVRGFHPVRVQAR